MILILSLVLSSGCAPRPSDACAGREPIYMAPETPAWLNIHDRPALVGIIVANEFGQSQGCWK